ALCERGSAKSPPPFVPARELQLAPSISAKQRAKAILKIPRHKKSISNKYFLKKICKKQKTSLPLQRKSQTAQRKPTGY
ncbi:MAG: hypothetical protein K2I09_00460, partial [Duncaniella sp.]|nr:hypothetical protein [Duncaniella sp.]